MTLSRNTQYKDVKRRAIEIVQRVQILRLIAIWRFTMHTLGYNCHFQDERNSWFERLNTNVILIVLCKNWHGSESVPIWTQYINGLTTVWYISAHTRLGRINGDIEDTGYEFAVLGVDSFRISPFVEQVIQLTNFPSIVVCEIFCEVFFCDFILRFRWLAWIKMSSCNFYQNMKGIQTV